jgi:hypothetical protein
MRGTMKWLLAVVLAASTLLACSEDHSGFYCPPMNFSSDDCRDRIRTAGCLDGGVTSSGGADGGSPTFCCNWQSCTKNPYPEL